MIFIKRTVIIKDFQRFPIIFLKLFTNSTDRVHVRPPHFIWNRLTPGIRQHLIRRSIDLSRQSNRYIFKIAETKEELEGAYRLLYDSYLRTGLMDPHPNQMRCNVYQSLPYTTTVICKEGNRIIGTIGIIKDSPIGFPSDKVFKEQNDFYRKKGFHLCELSALAVSPGNRGNHEVSLSLMKFMYFYITRYMNCTMMCATIHPRAFDFYAALFSFQRNGEIVKYEFANGALATHISGECAPIEGFMKFAYKDVEPEYNLYNFIFLHESPAMQFPKRKHTCVLDPIMTPELLKYFFVEKTEVFKNCSPEELSLVASAWKLHFDIGTVPYLKDVDISRSFRYPTQVQAVLLHEHRAIFGVISDLSEGGFFFQTDERLAPAPYHEIIFNFSHKTFRIPCTPRWHHEKDADRMAGGYGMEFLVTRIDLLQALREIMQVKGDERSEDEATKPDENIIPLKKAA